MDVLNALGIQIVLFLQGLGNWFIVPMKYISLLGDEKFYILILPVFYWCVDSAFGIRLGMTLLFNASLNSIFKILFQTSRPYWFDSRVKAYAFETSFGLPSGHAQNAVAVWGRIAAFIKTRWAWITAILLMFLIGLSRVAIGVHYPSDVLLGWILGAVILWAFLKWEPVVAKRLAGMRPLYQALTAFGASTGLILLTWLATLPLSAWTIPATWVQNIAAAGADPADPLTLTGVVSNAGTIFGMALGVIWLAQMGGFEEKAEPWKLALRFIVGLVGVLIFYMGLDLVFPDGESLLPLVLRYLRYGLTGFWVAGLAPVVFIKLGLAKGRKAVSVPAMA